jgi:hypothetical protein
MTLSRMARYPAEYKQIILAVPADGTPISIDFGSSEAAHKERLQLYNFLKFLHRNPMEASQFQGRHQLLTMSVKGTAIEFSLRMKAVSSNIAAQLAQLEAAGKIQAVPTVEMQALPFTAEQSVDFSQMANMPRPEPTPDPYARFNNAVSVRRPDAPLNDTAPAPSHPSWEEMKRRIGAEIAQDKAEAALVPKAPELSAEMKEWNDKHDLTQNKPSK